MVVICFLLALPLVLAGEYIRVTSPDGRFHAVAIYPMWRALIPMMPGQGGDKPGQVEVVSAAGASCGRVAVERVSAIQGLEWHGDRAEIRLVAEWDLANCRVVATR